MKAAQYAQEQGVPLPRLALKHSLQSADVAVTLLGMSSPDEVDALHTESVCIQSQLVATVMLLGMVQPR